MKELEQIDCEIRRVIDLQISVSDRLVNVEEDEHGSSKNSQIYNNIDNHHGGFLNGTAYAWLNYDSHLVVINVKTGESISSWNFCQKITSVSEFPTQSGESPLILVGLDNGASKIRDSTGLLCIFDCATSRVLRAIRMPVGVEQVCVVSGGAEWEEFNEKRPDSALNQMTGIACVVLRNLYHIVIDLQRPLWDGCESSRVMDESSPADMEFSTAKVFHSKNHLSSGKHTGYNLVNDRIEKHIGFNRDKFELSSLPNDRLTSAVVSSTKIGCLISGCLGRVIIWQNDGSVGWISPPISENVVVTHLDLLEPTDDPRPFYYLWVVLQDELFQTAPILRMYALLFERKFCEKGTNLYFNLEAEPSLKFEFKLDEGDRVISLSGIERDTSPEQTDSVTKRGEDSLLLISTVDRTYLFDLNQWYKEQMPQTIYGCQNPNSILASYNIKSATHNAANNPVICCSYVSSTLREFPNNYPNSTEELFYPNSLSLEWVELSLTKLTFWMTRGVQAELLREMAIAGPVILLQPAETFHRCLSVGLVPFNTECSFTSDRNVQREMLLSLCLEQRWATFLVKCAKEWSDGSASYLYPTFLKWGVQRASSIKMIADRLCIPLFDQSGSNIGEAEVRTLRFCSQQLECLSNVVAKIPLDTGDLIKQRQALRRVSTYFQVLLWFYDVGLLPETQELEEGTLPISLAFKIPYPFEKLTTLYKDKREQLKNCCHSLDQNEKGLFIDELMTRECSTMKAQWEREGGETNASSYYPPPSLQTLLRSYFIDCHENESNEIACKHQITIYLLMDLAVLLQGSYPGVDQLIKYPSAFKMSPSLIKLTQAFWLLDHEDYQGFLDMMTGQLVSDSDVKDWHHRLVLRTLVRNNQHKLALMYLRIRKPPLSSVEDQGTVIKLSVEHGLVQSAFHRRPPSHYAQLLMCFFQACRTYGKLNDILHLALDSEEEEVFVKFLKEDKFKDVQLLYYLQRCRYTEAINENSSADHKVNLQKIVQPTSFTMLLHAYNATLPDVTKRFSVNMAKTNADVDVEPRYPRPMSHYRGNKLQGVHGAVIKKAKETFLRMEKSQIPFISAPCTSLRTNDNNSSMNCVLFPKLAHGNRNKRTLDQIFDDEEDNADESDGIKRRRLSDGVEMMNGSDKKESGLNVTFNTPLVKRKDNVFAGKDNLPETPHSILKIRQLIKESTSPSVLATCTSEQDADSALIEKDKKANRQIRFSVGHSNMEAPHQRTSDNASEASNKANSTRESIDVFFSPNTSVKSPNESALLSDSSCSGKNIYHPRPRPGIRSNLQSPRNSLNDDRILAKGINSTTSPENSSRSTPVDSNNTTFSGVEPNKRSTSISARTPSKRCSLLSMSVYSSSVLSSDTSFEMSILRKKSDTTIDQCSADVSPEKDNGFDHTNFASPVLVTETVTVEESKRQINSVEVAETDGLRKFSSADVQHGDYIIESMEKDSREALRMIHSSFAEKEKSMEEEDALVVKTKSNDGVGETYGSREQESVIRKENQVNMEAAALSDDSGDESISLNWKDDDDDDDDAEEAYVSLSNSFEEEKQRHSHNAFSDKWPPNSQNNYKNGFQEFARIPMGDFDITDDESSSSIDHVTQPPTETKNSNENHVVPVPVSSTYDNCDVTDDESNSGTDPKYFNARNAAPNPEAQTAIVESASSNVGQREDMSTDNCAESNEGKADNCVDGNEGKVDNCVDGNEGKVDNCVESNEGKVESSLRDGNSDESGEKERENATRTQKEAPSNETLTVNEKPKTRAKSRNMSLKSAEQNEETVTRITRSRRFSCSMNDSNALDIAGSPLKNPTIENVARSRRASSLVKEVLSSSLRTVDDSYTDPVNAESPSGTPKRSQTRSSASALKESAVQSETKDTETPRTPLRRSTRRASSVQKEDLPTPLKNTGRRERTLSVSSVTNENNDEEASKKKAATAKKTSASKSVNKAESEKVEKSADPSALPEDGTDDKFRRKRGSSVPKESVMGTAGRTRRSSSVAKDILTSTLGQEAEVRKTRSSISRVNNETLPSSPAKNTRLRRLSIQSVPEELEEVVKAPTRERRASSVEPSQAETKRRTRNFRARSVLKDPIIEEPLETEESAGSKDVQGGVKKPTRRKRTTSVSSAKETERKAATEKTRKRVPSVSSEDKEQFAFSQPEKVDNGPVDQKDIGQVPKYVFSPPQTRSKHIPNQHRRKLNAFMSLPSQEEEPSQAENKTSQNNSGGYTRVIFLKQDVHRTFAIPKISKNIQN